ncbi:MAG: T9SS type A sorting domain-containing protein [Saprospiraceae bacterium]|nr:T9SS type A sorting domain-containing protein [Saprospiraceae bacterium]
MKQFSILFLLFFHSILAQGQVAAGIPDNMTVGQTFINLPAFAFNDNEYTELFDSMDVNSDGVFDVLFSSNAGKVPDYLGGGATVDALHPGFEMMVDTLGWVLKLAEGDSINAAQLWGGMVGQSPFSSLYISSFWGFSGNLQSYGHWIAGNDGYAGFRLIAPSGDTLYGWMRTLASVNVNAASASLRINSGNWAIQDAGASANDEPITGRWRIFPNPVQSTAMVVSANEACSAPPLLRVFDAQGRLRLTRQLNANTNEVSFQQLPAGIYTWELTGQRGKLIKL